MDYKDTVFLPKTDFPMKGSLSQREPELLEYWKSIDIYKSIRTTSKGRKKFILHYGPPYANGHIHIGHALTETLKDIINKTYQMMGYDAPMVPGWDCHGLPIEWKVEESYRKKGKNKDDVDPIEFRAECRAFANSWIPVQKEEFKRLGIIADWDNPYSTMDFQSEADIVEQLSVFLMNGALYRGVKPVMWSVVEKTALAEAEVEYQDHTSDSVYVAFPVIKASREELELVEAVIWTTTPWTLPGNRAIAYGPDISYVIIEREGRKFLVAEELLEAFVEKAKIIDFVKIRTLKGRDLKGTICAHPLREQGYDFDVPLLPGEHVTTDSGTGLVHTAPGHGQEDFVIGKEFGLEIPETVGPDGYFYAHVPLFSGQHVYKVNPVIMQVLSDKGALLASAKIVHSYPHSWRSKAPLIFRTTSQWFLKMDHEGFRERALSEIKNVKWFPVQGQNRIGSMVSDRPDWCLSRQRSWGTPIAIFMNKKTFEPLRDAEVQARIVKKIAEHGADIWFKAPAEEFLGDQYDANDYEKVTDVLDVWFDSGCTQDFVLRKRGDLQWPADLYLEGSDQHRGWFQSSLLVSVGVNGKAPYKNVITHGFTLDEKGYKMSKSLGNTVAPEKVIETMGADMLRLWVISADYYEDIRIGPEILKQQEDIYRRLRNTVRYLLGSLDGFTEAEKLDFFEMPSLEKWMLHRLEEMDRLHKKCVAEFDFLEFYTSLHTFCSADLSAFYFDIRKDCLYCDAPLSSRRRATRTVMDLLLTYILHWLAPVLSFTAEEAYLIRYGKQENGDSIHKQTFPTADPRWNNEALGKRWEALRDLRKVITGALEVERAAKTIRSSLQANVAVYVSPEINRVIGDLDIAELAITSDAEVICARPPAGAFYLDDVSDIGVVVNMAHGGKCSRCWRILPEVTEKNIICGRCEDAVVKGR